MTSEATTRDTALRWLRRGGALLLTVLVVEYFVLRRIVNARTDMSLLSSAVPALLVVAVTLEVCSLMSYSALTRAVLRPGHRPRFEKQLRIDLTGWG